MATRARMRTCLPASVVVVPSQRALIGAWTSSWAHPHSYQARVVTRDELYIYYALRNGSNLRIYRKGHSEDSPTLISTITGIETANGVQGDIASMAMDGNKVLHIAYYADSTNIDLVHRTSSDRGETWSSPETVDTDVAWVAVQNSSPAIHIASNNTIHIAYSKEAGAKPYHAYYSGSSWTLTRVADIANTLLRPTVITINSGRVFFSFTGSSDIPSVYYSDDNGASWTAANPSDPGNCYNCKLYGNGNTVYLVAQETDGVRTIILASTDGNYISWSSWDTISSGTGADPSFFIDSGNGKNVIWRRYNDTPFEVYHSRNTGSGWVTTLITDGIDHILPTSYWQEYHRFYPGYNKPIVILPESASNDVYLEYIPYMDLLA